MSNGNREEPKHLTGSTILTHCQAGMCCQRFSRKGGRLCPRPQLRRTSVAFQLISRRAGNLDRKALRSYTHTFWKGKPENVPFHLLEGKVVSPSGACVHLIGRSEDLLRLDPILGSENWHPTPSTQKTPNHAQRIQPLKIHIHRLSQNHHRRCRHHHHPNTSPA